MGALIGLLLTLATTTPPATHVAAKAPVFLQTSAEDDVGAMYVDKLRDALESSPSYKRVMAPNDAQFVIGIVTMDPNDAELGSGAGTSTVAAVTLQLENTKGLNYMVYSWVLVANRAKVDSLATELFAAIDKEIQDVSR
ncbi:MAG TPA: hypothetical protein VLV86_17445 [Vicinamibacterales bacterium]|nr:hypothetical protein [Vicinamibacterales bacterium]